MSEENKHSQGHQHQNIPETPRETPELPNLNENIEKSKTYSDGGSQDNKVPNIVDRGHPGITPPEPKEKK